MKISLKAYLIFILGLFCMSNCLVLAQEETPEEESAPSTTEEQEPAQQASEQGTQAQASSEEAAQAASSSVMDIKRLETEEPLYSFELRDVDITDLFRVLAHDYKLNLMVDKDVQGKVTASLSNVSLEEALDTIAESQNLILKKKGNIIKIVPNLVTKIFTLKYVEADGLLQSSGASSTATTTDSTSSGTSSDGSTLTQANTIYDILSSKGKVFLGRQPNSIIVVDYPPNVEKVGEYFGIIDQRMASRTFKLKYLKASDVVGMPSTSAATSISTSSSTTTGTSSTGGS